jgi:alkylation response protein AidB-like acyl-CoA dehydrogenase
MDFNYTEEQQMLADAVERWLEHVYGFDSRRTLAASATVSERNWSGLAELGVLGINVPQEWGGLGGGAVETLIVMQAFGRALLVEPFAQTAVIAARLLSVAGSAAQKEVILPEIAVGARRLALATLEPHARFDLARIETVATRRGGGSGARGGDSGAVGGGSSGTGGGGYILEGRKAVVPGGDSAHTLIVSARTAGSATDTNGITLFLVDSSAPGVNIRGFPTIDGLRAAEVTLSGVEVSSEAILGAAGAGFELLEFAVDQGIAALCAESVGAMERLLELTTEHLRTRRQFGQPIGSFQALQHRVAEMATAIEQARSIALLAASRADHPERLERRRAMSAAKAMVGRAGRFVGQQAVQLHGGMGMTDELAVGHYFKRLTCIDVTWGNAEHHAELYGDLL